MSAELFGVAEIKNPTINSLTGQVSGDVSHPFTYPLTLALFQFAFMGVIFLAIWCMLSQNHAADVSKVRENVFSPQWTGLVASHIFSTFWLQSLMMPVQMMSPGIFAASRALQVPAAAGFRWSTMGARFGGHPVPTTAMMFGAATLL